MFDIDSKGVLSTGVLRLLVVNRVGVGLTMSTINLMLPSVTSAWYLDLRFEPQEEW